MALRRGHSAGSPGVVVTGDTTSVGMCFVILMAAVVEGGCECCDGSVADNSSPQGRNALTELVALVLPSSAYSLAIVCQPSYSCSVE